jgi:hypothetical protein
MTIRHPRRFQLGICLLAFSALCTLTGCAGPQFISDLLAIIPIAGSAIAGVLSIVASFSGNPELAIVGGLITAAVTKVDATLEEANKLIKQYQSAPDETVLQRIEELLQTAVDDLKTVLTVDGVPASQAARIAALVNAVVGQIEALLSVLPVFKSNTAGQSLAVVKPIAAANFKTQIQAILSAPDPAPVVSAVPAAQPAVVVADPAPAVATVAEVSLHPASEQVPGVPA